jgi:co-chaperonin GroES (HSP10)
MKFTPRQDFVVVQMDVPAEETKQGILLPESAREDRVPAIGDRVIFNKFTAYELDEQERLYLLRGVDIGCKIND